MPSVAVKGHTRKVHANRRPEVNYPGRVSCITTEKPEEVEVTAEQDSSTQASPETA